MSATAPKLLGKLSRHAITLVSGVLVLGALLSFTVYRYTSRAEDARIAAEFEHRADVRGALTREIFDYYKSSVYALKSLFEGSHMVRREEFRQVASDILKRFPGITALEWIPVVPDKDRAEIERQLSQETGRPFQFFELAANGELVRAPTRPEHFPILYVEPSSQNERALGLDVQSAPTRRFLEQARVTRDFVISSQFELVQHGAGIIMAWPVFTSAPGETVKRVCKGFAQGVFRVREMLEQTQLHSPTGSIEMLYVDDTAESTGQRVLYYRPADDAPRPAHTPTEAEFRRGLYREYSINLGGRRWLALYRPSEKWLAEQRTAVPNLSLVTGLLISALLASLLSTMARRTSTIEREVAQRTAELSESRRQLTNLLHALPGMAYRCTCDDGLVATYVSDGAFTLTGYRADEFLSGHAHFRELIHPDDIERVRLLTRAALDTHGSLEVEYRIRPRTGLEKWVLSRGRSVQAGDPEGLVFEGLAIDITARKQAEADKIALERKLLESQKLESLGLLAGGIAHDFNNLLTGIMGHANLARVVPGITEDITGHLVKIESGATRAAELCQQMLAFSGRGHVVVEPVDLNVLIHETLSLIRGSLPARAQVELSLAPEPTMVMGDATQLRQIAMNLILNASDALGAVGGQIVVSTSRQTLDRKFFAATRVGETLSPGPYVVLEVSDTGCGMSADTLGKIFDPFFTTKFTGRGLGLAAVLGIVRGHAGALRVESNVGLGTTFTLALPPCREQSPASRLDGPAHEQWRRDGQVLVIDDEAPVRDVAAELIRTYGFTVVTAADGAEGIRHVAENPGRFDVVFLDLTMPGMDGIETLGRLRAINPKIRVLLVSGYSESERIATLAHDGSILFMQKPFTRARLEERLRSILA